MSTETKMYLDPKPLRLPPSFYFGGYTVRFGSCSPRISIYKNVNTATISKNTNR